MNYPKLPSKAILAPMEGINDSAFRILCGQFGCGMVFSEMVSAHALARHNQAAIKLLDLNSHAADERPFGVQLFGQDPEQIVKAALFVEEKYSPDVIDFNLGCPASQIVKQGAGCALLLRKSRIKEIVEACVAKLNTPFSVKMRSGVDSKHIVALEVARICEAAGACAITVHPRTMKQAYSGKADWQVIKQIKEAVGIPVIGNGDIFAPEDAERMMRQTGCDYVMIGRAAMKSPIIFQQVNDYLRKHKYKHTGDEARLKMIKAYLFLAKKHNVSFFRTKIHCQSFTAGMHGSAQLRNRISLCKDEAELRRVLGL
ncbi:tRNA dihydrouridine synthase DusB [Candidatus Woesearchaeota archaeon]|nr:tRNA dihydrouridine synthase DusB [Candidatus Woesearchaeota archaeon]